MDSRDDRPIEDGAARLLAADNEGQKAIRGRWRMLTRETRTALVQSGFYSRRGERLDLEGPSTSLPQHDVQRLEQAVGQFKLCLAAKLPLATEKGQSIPHEAHTDEVLSAAGELLLVREWQDPDFLRLALAAVAKHQQANALSRHTPESKLAPGWGCMGALLKVALVLTIPVALAVGLAASARQDVGGASLAFYLVGFGVLAILSIAGVGEKKKDEFELAYQRWTRFKLDGVAGVTGAGAQEHMRQMVKDGIAVPSIAFDVAEMLCRRMSGKFSEPEESESAED